MSLKLAVGKSSNLRKPVESPTWPGYQLCRMMAASKDTGKCGKSIRNKVTTEIKMIK
jgi:hypothetical protein